MKNKFKALFSIVLATLTFATTANDQASETAAPDTGPVLASCSPQPQCYDEETQRSAFQKWLEDLQQKQLQELLGIDPDQPAENSESTEG